MRRRYQMIDVFSETPLLGNPVAVILDADGLSSDEMLRITRWMNLSETTFLLPATTPKADYRVRIFTLDRELPFAGHPTLGSCRAWLHAGGAPGDRPFIVQECAAGLVRIRREDEKLAFAAPPLLRYEKADHDKIEEVARFLRIHRDQFRDIRWIDNGPGWLGVLLESAQAVLDLRPATSHPSRIEVGVVGPHPTGSEAAYEIRALFSDQHGAVREDPVTGSLNASVAQWLLESGRTRAPYVATQGRCLGRSGRIQVTADDADVWIGGNAITVVDGHIVI